ncbi:siderophore-interacting protein [Nocardioides sp.]|uniref:siderophore-interacting protein n=2 Tax=Nocardioides sp. TaxID=35761 RepID=UPI00273464BB|nr:siderophore-interacting protein [Nocardioides sp.]MDP3895014.1 siderophore-interacting protein [Nocardioides sp.]
MTTTTHRLPMILAELEAVSVERISPTFVRVELGGPELADLGVDGPFRDQRIKLVFPNDRGELPSFEGADESWLSTWREIPAGERGHMRTYTIRAVRGSGLQTTIVVDFVLHLAEGATGPGSAWAAAARPGDRLVILAPRRGMPFGGIEFLPGEARHLLLVGDETAVPAISSILEDLPDGTRGTAFLEVPEAGDVLDVRVPAGMEVVWLPREGGEPGDRLFPAVLAHLGTPVEGRIDVPAEEILDDLWETPTWSSSGEAVDPTVTTVGHDLDGLYAWIAGEAGVVTGLRRHLVKELGIDRHQVAFMGYWRQGVAMAS